MWSLVLLKDGLESLAWTSLPEIRAFLLGSPYWERLSKKTSASSLIRVISFDVRIRKRTILHKQDCFPSPRKCEHSIQVFLRHRCRKADLSDAYNQ